MSRTLLASAVLVLLVATAGADPERSLPAWFPMPGIRINPDDLQPEDYGHEEFLVEHHPNADDKTVAVDGRHWATSLYPVGDSWDGEAIWKQMKPALLKQGFTLVYSSDDGIIVATLRKGTGDHATWVEVTLSHDDANSNWVHILEVAPRTRTLKLVLPAAKPETFSDDQDFPYLPGLPGSKLLATKHYDGPLDVTTEQDQEPHLVGTGVINKLYEGLAGVSEQDFQATYADALKAAGWTIVDKNRASVVAHYTGHGRDLWVHVYMEGGDRMDIDVADVGTGMRAALDHGCKVALYGLHFDFNKATLRPDSDSVLKQVLGVLQADRKATFELRGHTDSVGDKAYNQNLSSQRADAVKKWLVAHGVAGGRLTTKGFGDTVPVVPNDTDANRAKNRRVELAKSGCSL